MTATMNRIGNAWRGWLNCMVRRWKQPSAEQLIELANRMRWVINPPEEKYPWWVIYNEEHQLGGGIATGKTLREALESGWAREEYIMGRSPSYVSVRSPLEVMNG